MKKLNICLHVTLTSSILSHTSDFESKYEKIYKKLASFLFEDSRKRLAVSFSGPLLSWIHREHSEFTQLLSKIQNRKQTEMIGGGYYSPIFPLIFPQDRTGQIELLTSELRQAVGKRPRGMIIFNSIWDNNLVPGFNACGMEYILLDSSLIPSEKKFFLPLIASEQGKSVAILPVNREFIPNTLVEPKEYLRNLFDTINYQTKNDDYNSLVDERVVVIRIDENQFLKLYDSKWLEKLFVAAREDFEDSIDFTLPLTYLHSAQMKIPSYIPAGIQSDVAIWARSPYKAAGNSSNFQTTVYDFLLTYKRNHALYNRMLYISMLINQCKGDKIRKRIAREKLWIAQSGEGYVCDPSGVFANNQARQYAYRNFTEAEKLCREAAGGENFKESVTKYDYNSDGHDEYVCSMNKYTACISKKGGQICEFDIIHNSGNYADSPSRMAKFDKVDDDYDRGLFIDHFFTSDEFAEYKKGLPAGNGIFSRAFYHQEDFDGSRHEIVLSAKGEYSSMRVPVQLKKKIIANSDGLMIQYILKNDGPSEVKGHLVVESNFAQTDFSSAKAISYNVEAISNNEGVEVDAKENPRSSKKISYVQLTDSSNDISFVFEPNEECDLVCMPIVFHRPSNVSDAPQISGTAFVASLAWNVELPSGGEMEKTINFSIIVPKKRSSKKN